VAIGWIVVLFFISGGREGSDYVEEEYIGTISSFGRGADSGQQLACILRLASRLLRFVGRLPRRMEMQWLLGWLPGLQWLLGRPPWVFWLLRFMGL
jgi:hypothetical protein